MTIPNLCTIELNGGIFQYFLSYNPIQCNSSNEINLKRERIIFQLTYNDYDDKFIEFSNKYNLIKNHKFGTRIVKFDLKHTIHTMHTWQFAYKSARKDIWQQLARDHARFKNRIDEIDKIISPILLHNTKTIENNLLKK